MAVSLVLTGADSYAANNCWLTIEYGIIYWTFVVPVAIIVLVSGVLFKLFIFMTHQAFSLTRDWSKRITSELVLTKTWKYAASFSK